MVSTRERRIDLDHLQMRLPDRENEEFLILRSFVPVSDNGESKQLTSFMVGLSDPEDYGQLHVYEMPNLEVDGPAIVNANMLQSEEISQLISLLNQQGSSVKLGSLLLIPIEESLLYVRPLYVVAQGDTPVPQLKNVIVAFGNQVEMRSTLKGALEAIFGEAPDTLEEDPGGYNGEDPSGETPEEPTGTAEEQIAALLVQAEDLFAEADQALAEGDLGTYQPRSTRPTTWCSRPSIWAPAPSAARTRPPPRPRRLTAAPDPRGLQRRRGPDFGLGSEVAEEVEATMARLADDSRPGGGHLRAPLRRGGPPAGVAVVARRVLGAGPGAPRRQLGAG